MSFQELGICVCIPFPKAIGLETKAMEAVNGFMAAVMKCGLGYVCGLCRTDGTPNPLPFMCCIYCLIRKAFLSSLVCAKQTYNGFVAIILLFVWEIAFCASSGVEKQTKPKPREWFVKSVITLAEVILPKAENSLWSLSSSMESSKFLTYKLMPL